LNTPRSPLVVTADKAYDSQTARQQIKDEGALPIIPNRRNAIKQAYCPKRFYRQRHKIENFFCRIKDWRRIATRYDKLARNFLAAATLIGALYWIKLWVQTLAYRCALLKADAIPKHLFWDLPSPATVQNPRLFCPAASVIGMVISIASLLSYQAERRNVAVIEITI
jgi:putative transposase